MNKVELTGRLTKDPSIKYTQEQTCVARFTLAVDRKKKSENGASADFIPCVAFSKTGEFAEKYAKKGMKFEVVGRIQTGSYKKDDQTVYTTDVVVEEMGFAESKKESTAPSKPETDEFMNVPDDVADGLPFN